MNTNNFSDDEPHDSATMTPEAYLATLPKRIMDVANSHQVVHMQINSRFIPLLAADLMRGQSLRMSDEHSAAMADSLLAGAKETPAVSISVPSPVAKILAHDLMVGQNIRRRLN